jgi:hypothetical protein
METTPPSARGKEIDEIRYSIDAYVTGLADRIKQYLQTTQLPVWGPPQSADEDTREFYVNLAIPMVKDEPSLLLHNLQNTSNPHSDRLFMNKKHRRVPIRSIIGPRNY